MFNKYVQAQADYFLEKKSSEELKKTAGFVYCINAIVQVLCPMTRGVMGTRNLNNVLQQLINPPGADKVEITRGGMTLRVGDKVIQQTNDYEREVFNGDVGFITKIDTEEQEVTVRYLERDVVYDYADLNEIALAWSVSVHKSQGSEYPVVILPLYMQHYMMLTRNLFYTGLTRAKRLAIVVGSKKAISLALRSTPEATAVYSAAGEVGAGCSLTT